MIAAFSALRLILLIMIFITRNLVAALVIVGTVVLSLGSVGLSALVWQYIFGMQLYWIVVAIAVILLLSVDAEHQNLDHLPDTLAWSSQLVAVATSSRRTGCSMNS